MATAAAAACAAVSRSCKDVSASCPDFGLSLNLSLLQDLLIEGPGGFILVICMSLVA